MTIVTNWDDYAPYFTKEEFDCKETGENQMQQSFMDWLFVLRKDFNRPMIITSGYRSITHSIEAAKPKPGEHTMGLAADIQVLNSADRHLLTRLAITDGCRRIGIANTFIHLGMSQNLPQRVIWLYS